MIGEQLEFDFVFQLDRELAEGREQSRQRNEDAWLHSTVEEMPPKTEEWDVILMGIRLCRHMHPRECEACKLSYLNHCPDVLGTYWEENYNSWNPIKVCLKDYFKWCARHGLKNLIRKEIRK